MRTTTGELTKLHGHPPLILRPHKIFYVVKNLTLSVKVTFRRWGSNSIDALSGIHVSLIPKSILILTEILTLRGKGVGGLRITSA